MKIAVTGASGFIGGNLSKHLKKQGREVIALVRKDTDAERFRKLSIESRIADIRDAESLEAGFQGCDVVVHLAALFNNPESSWEEYRDVNVEGTKRVLFAAQEVGARKVVHCSTVGVATGQSRGALNEEAPYSPPDWDKYETTKCEGEKAAIEFHQHTGFPVAIVRPAQPYGPGDKSKLKFYKLVRKGIIVNPGDTMKHLIHIDDLCRGIELSIERDEANGEVIILAGKMATPLHEVIGYAADVLGVPRPKVMLPAAPVTLLCDVTERTCNLLGVKPVLFRRSMDFFTKTVEFDVRKAKEVLGFESEIDVVDGISQTISWYRSKNLL